MAIKAALSLLVGLVFQLAQVWPLVAACTTSCPQPTATCACCAGGTSCPCAHSGDDHPQAPSNPADHPTDFLKLLAARTVVTTLSLDTAPATPVINRPHAQVPTGPTGGYQGVSLAVAFCSFVI